MRREDRQLWNRVKRTVSPLDALRGAERGPVPTKNARKVEAKRRGASALLGEGARTNTAGVPRGAPTPTRADLRGTVAETAGAVEAALDGDDPVRALEAWWWATGGGSRMGSKATGAGPALPAPSVVPAAAETPGLKRGARGTRRAHGSSPPGPLDRTTTRKIAKRRLPLDGRFDLHGMTEAEAHARLLGYLERAREAGLRHVVVITGKGRGAGGRGALKRAVPRWLATPPFARLVTGHATAGPRDGGEGALYVKLRKVARP